MIDFGKYMDKSTDSIYDEILPKLAKFRKKYSKIPDDKYKEIIVDAIEFFKNYTEDKLNFEEFIISRLDVEKMNYDPYFSDDIVNEYLREISNIPLLSKEEEHECALKAKNGDKEAKEKLATSNLRLVVNLARRYVEIIGVNIMDLIQEGNLGLLTAADRFDVDKGFRFSTYATWWIMQALIRSIQNQSRTVRLPIHINEDLNKYIAVHFALKRDLGREPSTQEMANAVGLSMTKVLKLQLFVDPTVSLNTPVGEDKNSELGSFIPAEGKLPDDEAIDNLLRDEIFRVFDASKLTDKEKYVLTRRYGLDDKGDATLEEISQEFNVSRERIRQIENKAFYKLRKNKETEGLADYSEFPEEAIKDLEEFRKKAYSTFEINKSSNIFPNREVSKKRPSNLKEIFKDYTSEQFEKMLKSISEDDMKLLNKYISEDHAVLSKEELKYINTKLIPAMKRSIKVVKKANINNGDNPDHSFFKVQQDRKQVNEAINLIETLDFNIEKIDNVKNFIKSSSFADLLQYMNGKEALAVSLRLGFIKDVELTSEEVSKCLDISEEKLRELSKKTLHNRKRMLISNKYIDYNSMNLAKKKGKNDNN